MLQQYHANVTYYNVSKILTQDAVKISEKTFIPRKDAVEIDRDDVPGF